MTPRPPNLDRAGARAIAEALLHGGVFVDAMIIGRTDSSGKLVGCTMVDLAESIIFRTANFRRPSPRRGRGKGKG